MSDDSRVEVLVLRIDLHLPLASSLKAKRSVVQSVVRTLDGWKGVSAAEVGFTDKWQRTRIGVSIVGGSVAHLDDVAAAVERHVWAVPDADVLSIEQQWFEWDTFETSSLDTSTSGTDGSDGATSEAER